MAEIWERQEGETSSAYTAFCAYRNMGVKRSIDTAYRIHLGQPDSNKQASGGWTRWSTVHQWRVRAEAWDDENERELMITAAQEIKDMSMRHARIAMLFQNKVIGGLQAVDEKKLTPQQLAVWFDVSSKIERLARGEPTERVARENVPQMDGEAGEQTHISVPAMLADQEAADLACALADRVYAHHAEESRQDDTGGLGALR